MKLQIALVLALAAALASSSVNADQAAEECTITTNAKGEQVKKCQKNMHKTRVKKDNGNGRKATKKITCKKRKTANGTVTDCEGKKTVEDTY